MQPVSSSGPQSSALWPVDLKLTHLDWNPETSLIHFQGKHPSMCELDYIILQCEIQRAAKARAAVDVGDLCLVEDLASANWYRGRVQDRKEDGFDVFLIDYGNILSVGAANISSCSDDLFSLLPKMVCGFLSSVLISPSCPTATVEQYLATLVGKSVTGYTRALLPYKVLILEVPEINEQLVQHGFGRHVDADTFLSLVEMLTEIPREVEPAPDLLVKSPGGKGKFRLSALQAYRDLFALQGPRIKCGTQAAVYVTAAAGPRFFHCRMTSAEGDLWEISQKLTAVYEGGATGRDGGVQENLGPLCAARGKDGRWHRGFLPFLPDKSQIRVFFIDYGFFESVGVEDVHRLPDGLDSAPFLAFPCRLSDADEGAKARQLSFLKSGLLGGVLDLEVRDFDHQEHLYAVVINGAEGKAAGKAEPLPKTKPDPVSEDLALHNSFLYLETIIQQSFARALGVEQIGEGATFLGNVAYALNPDRFWVRSEKRTPDLEELTSRIGDHFREVGLDEDVLASPQLGTLCCAMYEKDLHFYRALVIGRLLHGCEVFFIDFGNIEKVPHKLIKKIPAAFAEAPAFAICCSLDNAVPPGEVWTTATCESFRGAVAKKALRVRVVRVSKSSFVVDLREAGRDDAPSVSELIASSGEDGFQSGGGGGVPARPLWRDGEDRDAEESGKTWSEEEERTAETRFKTMTIKPGCGMAVCCACVTSPSDFWCLPLEKVQALEELMAKIQLHYSAHTVPLLPQDSCCVVQSPSDQKFYRAAITERRDGRCSLSLVDYGYSIEIQESHLQGILPEFLRLEKVAFWCSLSRLIQPADPVTSGGWSPEARRSLKGVVHGEWSLRCVVVSQWRVGDQGLHVVELYSSRCQQGVTGFLLERGLAREAAAPPTPSSDVPESFVYSSFDLGPGSEEDVFVTHVVSQGEVYCQLQRNADLIEDLETKISEEAERRTPLGSGAAPENLCLAKYFDGHWYRGLVHPVQSPLHLGVFFVDYGNSSISEKSQLAAIPADAAPLLFWPAQALRFRLAAVPRAELYADVSRWLSEAVLNRQVKARVVGAAEDGSFEAELFDGDASINQKVTELVLGLSPKAKPRPSLTPEAKPAPPNAAGKAEKRPGTPAPASCAPNAKRGGRVYARLVRTDAARIRSYVVPPRHRGKKTGYQKPPEPPAETPAPRAPRLPDVEVSEGLRALCFVSHVDSLASFFLHRADDEAAILKLVEDLNSEAFRGSLTGTSPASLRPGDLVLAEYEEDGALYRSVVKRRDGNAVEVEFVDYGNCSVMEDKVFSLPEDFLSQPRFSVPCSLSGDHAFQSDASFAAAVMETPLLVQFVRRSGPRWEVVLVEEAAAPPEPPDAEDGGEELEREPEGDDEQEEVATETEEKMAPTPPVYPSSKVKRGSCRSCGRGPARVRRGSRAAGGRRTGTPAAPGAPGATAATPLNIGSGDREPCTLLSVTRDGGFYVRLRRSLPLLAALERSVSLHLHRCEPVLADQVRRGLRCLVQVPGDGRWHRAAVQRALPATCLVLLLDHGTIEEVPLACVRRRCDRLADTPGLAVACQMDSLRSVQESLQPAVGGEVGVVFLCYSEADELWKVEMFVNALLLMRPASPRQPAAVVASPPQRLSFAPVQAGRAYRGFAAAAKSPSEFCVLLEDSLLVLKEVSAVLGDPPQRLRPLPEDHLLPGSCCLLRSGAKRKWCRAEIVHAGASLVLNLLDYGLYECLPHQGAAQLRMLPPEVRGLPKVIHPCVLRGVKPAAGGHWSQEAALCFRRCLDQKKLLVFFRERVTDTTWAVDLLADGVHVAQHLVHAGHAHYLDVAQDLRFQDWSLALRDQEEDERPDIYDGFLGFSHRGEDVPFSVSSRCSLM